MSENLFISESNFLFPRKFDRSRHVFCYNVNVGLREVDWSLDTWAGHNGELIARERGSNALDAWSETFHYATRSLWSQLELQCHPEDRCSSRHRDFPDAG